MLVQTRTDVAPVIRATSQGKSVERRSIAGLAVWQKPDVAIARIGPTTLAVGTATDVDTLVEVRLGMERDLKITGPPFERFQAADRESTLRLMSRDPAELSRMFHPIFTSELVDGSKLLGFALTLQNPIRGRLLRKT